MTALFGDSFDHPLQVVLVGFGHAGLFHGQIYCRLAQSLPVRVVAVVEPNRERWDLARQLFGAQTECYLDLQSGWSQIAPDAPAMVDVCTPNDQHLAVAQAAIAQGVRRLLIEKPLTMDLHDASAWRRLAADPGLFSVVTYQYLHSTISKTLRRWMRQYQLKPTRMRSHFVKNRSRDSRAGRGRLTGGGVPHSLWIEMPHQISIATSIVGAVRRVARASAKDLVGQGDALLGHAEVEVTLEHQSGVVTTHFSSLSADRTERNIEIECERGYRLLGSYSCDGSFRGSTALEFHGRCLYHEELLDESLGRTLLLSLQYFLGEPKNPCTVGTGLQISRIIGKAEHILRGQMASSH